MHTHIYTHTHTYIQTKHRDVAAHTHTHTHARTHTYSQSTETRLHYFDKTAGSWKAVCGTTPKVSETVGEQDMPAVSGPVSCYHT
jgi:hypothetical protein